MPIFIPVVVGTVVRYAVGGAIVYMAGKTIVAEVDEAAGETMDGIEADLKERGAEIITEAVEELGDLSLAFIRGVIPAIIDGAKAGYDAIRDGFRGKEPETIAALTISVLVLITVLTLLHEVRTGPGGAGEYAAGNRP